MVHHALDPLSPEEIRRAADVTRLHFRSAPVRFNDITLLEPPKRSLLDAQRTSAALPRAARVVASVGPHSFELDVDLTIGGGGVGGRAAVVTAQRPIDLRRGQPLATADDCLLAEEIARTDPRVQRACAKALRALSEFDYDAVAATPPPTDAELVARHVAFDPWALHHCPEHWTATANSLDPPPRVMQVFAYEKPSPRHNEYARPLPVVAAVDLGQERVIDVEERLWEAEEEEEEDSGKSRRRRPPPPGSSSGSGASTGTGAGAGEYAAELRATPPRANPPRPLRTSQPQGPSYRVDPTDPWRVEWQGWSFRVGFTAREGLVLHDVSFAPYGGGGGGGGEGGGGPVPVPAPPIPIAHRLSMAEMCVPYSDPRPPYDRRCALDAGDYGLGAAAVSQSSCLDCAGGGDVLFFSPCLCDARGEPRVLDNAVCVHEVDAGLLWKHVDYREEGGGGGGDGHGSRSSGGGAVRRARELVVGFSMVAVNYDYVFHWIFGLDGTIRVEVRLTGVLSTSRLTREEALSSSSAAAAPGRGGGLPTHGTLVAPCVNAGHHQHLFCARLDLCAGNARGGDSLVVSEVDPVPAPAVANSTGFGTAGNGFTFRETPLLVAPAGRSPAIGRVWRVADPAAPPHPLSGQPRALELRLSSPATLLAAPDSAAARRAVFATRALWVTPHRDGEFFPTGAYAMNAREDTGPMAAGVARGLGGDASAGAAKNSSIPDPVIWLTFGVTHEVRPEDYPVMPRDVCSFEIRPFGLLAGGNPAVDLPPPNACDGAKDTSAAAFASAAAAPRSRL